MSWTCRARIPHGVCVVVWVGRLVGGGFGTWLWGRGVPCEPVHDLCLQNRMFNISTLLPHRPPPRLLALELQEGMVVHHCHFGDFGDSRINLFLILLLLLLNCKKLLSHCRGTSRLSRGGIGRWGTSRLNRGELPGLGRCAANLVGRVSPG